MPGPDPQSAFEGGIRARSHVPEVGNVGNEWEMIMMNGAQWWVMMSTLAA